MAAKAKVPAIPWAAWVCKKISGCSCVTLLVICEVTFSCTGEVLVGKIAVGIVLPFRTAGNGETVTLPGICQKKTIKKQNMNWYLSNYDFMTKFSIFTGYT